MGSLSGESPPSEQTGCSSPAGCCRSTARSSSPTSVLKAGMQLVHRSARISAVPDSGLTVAVTGPTGTFGFGLMPLLQADERIARIVGIARRPFDANKHGWTKMTYRRGDVRDRAALEEAFQGADVIVHLAFMIIGA